MLLELLKLPIINFKLVLRLCETHLYNFNNVTLNYKFVKFGDVEHVIIKNKKVVFIF